MATSKSVIKYQGGRGYVLMRLDDEKSIKLEMASVTMTATYDVMEFRGGDNNFPVAYSLGNGTATVEGTISQNIDEDEFRNYLGYDKIANTTAVTGRFKVVATVAAGEVDLTDGPEGIPTGGSVIAESVYVRLNDTGVDLASADYVVGNNVITGLTTYNGRVVVVEGIYSTDSYEWAKRGADKGKCVGLYIVFPLSDYACTATTSYRVVHIPRAFVVPDAELTANENPLAAPIRFRVAPDAAGYLWYESIMENPET